jgi:ferrous iron transport protein B
MATRTIEGKNDRLITILITPFMSCSARLPVYVLIISAFFPEHPGSMLFLIYTIGILMAAIMALVFRKTIIKAKELPFVMELPPYRIPTAKTIFKHMWFKAAMYLKKMSGVIMIASLIIWALSYFPMNVNYTKNYEKLTEEAITLHEEKINSPLNTLTDDSLNTLLNTQLSEIKLQKQGEKIENSLIGRIGKFIEPAVSPMGFDWRMGVSLLTGMAAKEIVVSTMGVLYQSDLENNGTSSLTKKLQTAVFKQGKRSGEKVYTKSTAFAFMIFILFYFPCVAVISAVRHETGKWKWAIFVTVYTTGLAWVFSFLVYQIGSIIL